MTTDKTNLELWIDKGLTLTDRINNPPVVQRDDVSSNEVSKSLGRGDISQELRLRFYPSIKIDFDEMYAGSFSGTLEELEEKLFDMGYRNNPTAYVEITDTFGPDDGSYARQFITENDEFPYLGLGRPFCIVTWWNRVKLQVHVTAYVDDKRDLVHIAAHEETSAWFQPVRHIRISESDADIGVREFRQDWKDEFNQELPKLLS